MSTENSSPWPREGEMVKFYGNVGTGQVMLDLPYPLRLAWAPNTVVRRMSLHRLVAPSAHRVLTRVLEHYGLARIRDLRLDVWGGSLNVRKKRGGSTWSTHAWGAAIDWDPDNNQLTWGRDRAHLARPEYGPFWEAWETEGWVSLGRTRNFDWMHVQAART